MQQAGLQVAGSAYYATKSRQPSARAQRDAWLGPALRQLWEHNYCVYGQHKLKRPGFDAAPV